MDLTVQFEEQEDGSWVGVAVIGERQVVAAGDSEIEVAFLLGAAAYRAGLVPLEDDDLIQIPSRLMDN